MICIQKMNGFRGPNHQIISLSKILDINRVEYYIFQYLYDLHSLRNLHQGYCAEVYSKLNMPS